MPQTQQPRPILSIVPTSSRCAEHPAYEADYCPRCGTAQVIGR